ncbi:MAG: hypothetical protein Q7S23_02465, partial [bacterium]|nr:hypothetical protein [bacterium]
GIWEFAVPTPLSYGFHHLAITAVSPINPTLRASAGFWFQVVPIPLVPIPSPTPTPKASPQPMSSPRPSPAGSPTPTPSPVPTATPFPVPPPAPPQPPTILPPLPQLLDVELLVQPPNIQVNPPQPLPLTVRVERLLPDIERPVEVRLKVMDESGRVIFDRTREVLVSDVFELTEEVVLPARTFAGRYWVSAEVQYASTTVISSRPFIVASTTAGLLPLMAWPQTPDALVRLGALFGLLLAFLAWWGIEFARARRQGKVEPQDLQDAGMVR